MERRSLSLLVLLIAMASIQLGASLAKQLFPLLGASGTTMLRTSLAALILLSIWRPWKRTFPAKALGAISLYGACLGLMNLLFYSSLSRIPLGVAVALEFTGPLSVAIYSSRRPSDWLWVGLATLGIVLFLPFNMQGFDLVGIAFALGAGVCWGFYIVFGQRACRVAKSGDVTALGMLVAAAVVFPIGLPGSLPHLNSLHTWLIALAVAVFSSALPYSLEMLALRHLPAHTFGIFMSIEPALAAIVGFIFLSEHLSLLNWLAIACIMLASAGSAAGRGNPQLIPIE